MVQQDAEKQEGMNACYCSSSAHSQQAGGRAAAPLRAVLAASIVVPAACLLLATGGARAEGEEAPPQAFFRNYMVPLELARMFYLLRFACMACFVRFLAVLVEWASITLQQEKRAQR